MIFEKQDYQQECIENIITLYRKLQFQTPKCRESKRLLCKVSYTNPHKSPK